MTATRKPLRDRRDSALERALGVMGSGWCPFPYLGVPVPGEVGLDISATCACGKRVRVTARGLYAHHKSLRKVSRDEVKRRFTGDE